MDTSNHLPRQPNHQVTQLAWLGPILAAALGTGGVMLGLRGHSVGLSTDALHAATTEVPARAQTHVAPPETPRIESLEQLFLRFRTAVSARDAGGVERLLMPMSLLGGCCPEAYRKSFVRERKAITDALARCQPLAEATEATQVRHQGGNSKGPSKDCACLRVHRDYKVRLDLPGGTFEVEFDNPHWSAEHGFMAAGVPTCKRR